jgi:uncharacterized protein (TIGR02646 family)
MLRLNTSTPLPSVKTLKHLATKQGDIDGRAPGDQAARAQTLWDAKMNPKPGKAAFGEVKQLLLGMCVSVELCNYCEHDRAIDIEHVWPKSIFPTRTFQWSNYLLACSACNSRYKGDKFAVFTPALSANVYELKRSQPAPSTDPVFIDPRTEDPMDFFFLDIRDNTFYLIPHPNLTDTRSISKAQYTLTVLQIGQGRALANARRAAFQFFQDRLDRYRRAEIATTWDELEDIALDPHLVNRKVAFAAERQRMLDGLKESILNNLHPTVWREMQRQHPFLNKVKRLFEAVPDALTWV